MKIRLNYKFIISIAIITLIFLGEVREFYSGNVELFYVAENAVHCFLKAIYTRSRTLVPLIIILSSWIYSDKLIKEWKSGYLRIITTRISFKKYVMKSFMKNAILVYLMITIPLLILFVVSRMLFDNNFEVLNSFSYYNPQGILRGFYINNPDLYMIFTSLVAGIPFVVFSSIGMAGSFLLHNRILVVTIPFLVYTAIDAITIYIPKLDMNFADHMLTWIREYLSKDVFIFMGIGVFIIGVLFMITKKKGVIL